ncbi:MAG: hypothetical protein LBP35_00850 [Candidatus Ancillula trichonymphae]|nr:hypothetical protein [Candidatus Ancillula trichonymphae]
MLDSFVAIDFETANKDPRSAVQVGAVRVENGELVDNYESLILSEDEYSEYTNYFPNCANVVEIHREALKCGRSWPLVYKELEEFARGMDFVAHNATFDRRCLYSLNKHFDIDNYPPFWDTYMNARRLIRDEVENYKLATLSFFYNLTTPNEYGIKGHSAFYDAGLCAKLCLKIQEFGKLKPMGLPSSENFRPPSLSEQDIFDAQVARLLLEIEPKSRMTFLAYIFAEEVYNIKLEESEKFGFKNVITATQREFGESVYASSYAKVQEKLGRFGKLREENKLSLPTDGVVIKCVDDARISKLMGFTAHHPSSQIAFKYPPVSALTTVKSIEVSVGRTGRLSFRAKFEPIELDGVKIQYATLHNAVWLKEKGVRIGSVVKVVRANDVIPYVSTVVSNSTTTSVYVPPSVCPMCETPINKDTLLWRCPNDDCTSRVHSALEVAVSRKFLNIDALSTETLANLINSGVVRDIDDIFALTEDALAGLVVGKRNTETKVYKKNADLFGEQDIDMNLYLGAKTARTIMRGIVRAKNAPLHKILASLNIRLLGLEVAKNLVRHFGSIDAILSATYDELIQVPLISETKAVVFLEQFGKKRAVVGKLASHGVKALKNSVSVGSNGALTGHTVVVSGSLPNMTREEAFDRIEELGGDTSSTVSAKTTLLVADENSTTSKVKKAKALGVKIVAPDEFLKIYGIEK